MDKLGVADLETSLIYSDDRDIYRFDLPLTVSADAAGKRPFLILKIRSGDDLKGGSLSPAEKEEFERASRAWEAASAGGKDASDGMSCPVALSTEFSAILMTGCEGQDFSHYMHREALLWPFRGRATRRRFAMAGKWLAAFHQGTVRQEAAPELVQNRIEHLERMLSYISQSPSNTIPAAAISERISSSLSSSTLPVALIHGNFALRNLLVDDSGIRAIDFEDSREDCPAYDIGQFVAEILVRGFLPSLPRRTVLQWQSSFMNAYELTASLDAKLADAYTGYHLLAFYYEHARRRGGRLSKYRQAHIKKELLAWLQT